MTRKGKTGLIVAVVCLVIIVPLAGYLLSGRETRGLVSFFLWKAFSSESGEGRYAEINGARIYYEVHGRGMPLLLMHGGTVFIESLYNQVPALAGEFMVIAPDSREHGRSTGTTAELGYGVMAKDMCALLDGMGVGEVFVVGWSDGGIIGMQMAMSRPGLVKKLVTIGSNYRADGMTASSIAKIRSMGPDDADFAEVKDYYRRIAPEPDRWPVFFNRVRTMWLTQPNYSAADLERIAAPTLVILGERDDIRRDHAQEMARFIPNGKLEIIRDAGHLVPLEKPEELNRKIIAFLKAKPPRDRAGE